MTSAHGKRQYLAWNVGYHSSIDKKPTRWIDAKVPGAVQLDYARAKNWRPYRYGNNFKKYDWMEDVFWTYRSMFTIPKFEQDQRIFFICKGIDYQFTIILNDIPLLSQEGMFTPVQLDITDILQSNNRLYITVFPAPKSHNESVDRTQTDQSVKPAVSYGWDWHTRLIPCGIWDETYLLVKNRVYIISIDFGGSRIPGMAIILSITLSYFYRGEKSKCYKHIKSDNF